MVFVIVGDRADQFLQILEVSARWDNFDVLPFSPGLSDVLERPSVIAVNPHLFIFLLLG